MIIEIWVPEGRPGEAPEPGEGAGVSVVACDVPPPVGSALKIDKMELCDGEMARNEEWYTVKYHVYRLDLDRSLRCEVWLEPFKAGQAI